MNDLKSYYSYTTWHFLFYLGSFIAMVITSIALSFKIWTLLDGFTSWIVLLCGLFFGYLLADFASGMFHWFFDRYGSMRTPFIGKTFIYPFREHHALPKEMTKHDFWEVNGPTAFVVLPFLCICIFAVPSTKGSLGIIFCLSCFLFGGITGGLTNQIHKWVHQDRVPAFISYLEKYGLILSKEVHKKHHTNPFNTYYCITSGWMNPLLARLNFFSKMEDLIFLLTGVQAGKEDKEIADAISEKVESEKMDHKNNLRKKLPSE